MNAEKEDVKNLISFITLSDDVSNNSQLESGTALYFTVPAQASLESQTFREEFLRARGEKKGCKIQTPWVLFLEPDEYLEPTTLDNIEHECRRNFLTPLQIRVERFIPENIFGRYSWVTTAPFMKNAVPILRRYTTLETRLFPTKFLDRLRISRPQPDVPIQFSIELPDNAKTGQICSALVSRRDEVLQVEPPRPEDRDIFRNGHQQYFNDTIYSARFGWPHTVYHTIRKDYIPGVIKGLKAGLCNPDIVMFTLLYLFRYRDFSTAIGIINLIPPEWYFRNFDLASIAATLRFITGEQKQSLDLYNSILAMLPESELVARNAIKLSILAEQYDRIDDIQEKYKKATGHDLADDYLDQFIEINGKAPKKTATLSVCLIIRDEEKTIERAIASIKPVADEIIVVDTGSNDRSAEIAASIGARIYDFPWADDFSAARNFAISKSTCDYIFMLDGDEYISPFFYIESQTFKSLLPLGKPCAFSVSIGTYFNETDWLFLVTEQGNFRTECSSVRFFPRMTGLAFREKIVESIEQTLLEKDVPVHVIPMNVLQIVHDHDNRNARIKRKVPIYEMIDNPGEKIILAAIRDISSIGRTQETIKWLRTYYSNQTGITEKIKMGIHLAGLLASSDLLQADNLYRDLIRTYPESTDLISAYIGFLITNNRIAEIAGLELPDSPLKDKNASFQIGCIRSLQHFEAGDQEKAFEILIEHLDANAYELFPQAIRFYYMASLNNIEGVVSSLDTLFTLIGKRKDFHINQIEDIFAMVEELYTSMCKSAYRTECSLILYGITILGLTWGVS